ncbi:MAG: nickel pincer cofactor biosynthesis protein LarC [Candidatus Nitrosopolaris wilkensis]|nr:MAG: nickel pincer cofactor biosynthesis protein LarC [Candidatus Nitrosopolaris wilkensis]
MTSIAIIDSQISGISGDMLLASLVDAGANERRIIDAILACQNFLKGSKIESVRFSKTITHGFSAMAFSLDYTDNTRQRRGMDMYRSLAACCDSLDLEQRAKVFALECLKTIIVAEAFIHGEDTNHVYLDETSSVDTFADLIGCAAALQDLNLFESRILSTKVAVGGGTVTFSHGTVPNPTSAVLEIFKGKHFILAGGQVSEEITTPTGAAILVNLASESINHYPTFTPLKIGYGVGQKIFDHLPNILRFIIGGSSLASEAYSDTSCLIETTLDDISGEIIGNLIEQLSAGAVKDVIAIPGIAKKNRPTHLIRIICDHANLNNVLMTLFSETGTIGARFQEIQRLILPRSIVTVPVNISGYDFNVRVKISRGLNAEALGIKPEFDDVKVIASTTGISVKRALELVSAQITYKINVG